MKIALFISFFLFFSCIGKDTAFLPNNIGEARSKQLLISEFSPSNKIVIVGKSRYLIEEAFTTTKFNSKRDSSINNNFFSFVLVIKSLETGAYGLDTNDAVLYDQFIKFPCQNCGGIVDHKVVINYENFQDREKLDSVKISFISENNEKQAVFFVRKWVEIRNIWFTNPRHQRRW